MADDVGILGLSEVELAVACLHAREDVVIGEKGRRGFDLYFFGFNSKPLFEYLFDLVNRDFDVIRFVYPLNRWSFCRNDSGIRQFLKRIIVRCDLHRDDTIFNMGIYSRDAFGIKISRKPLGLDSCLPYRLICFFGLLRGSCFRRFLSRYVNPVFPDVPLFPGLPSSTSGYSIFGGSPLPIIPSPSCR